MPLYGPSARLLEPATRAGLCSAWDATAACCQPKLGGANGGDTPLISAVIDASLAALPSIDPKRVFIVGIANGGFMAQRVACEIGDRLAGVLAYASGLYASQCAKPEKAPSMLIMQGDVDVVVPYAGGKNSIGNPFPGHVETVGIWKGMLRCQEAPHSSSSFRTVKQEGLLPPPQLDVFTDSWSNCSSRAGGGGARKLDAWRIQNGQHFAMPGTSADIFQRALAEMLQW
jgi:poly(3-hydroxybutyrate) depolymerase